MIEKLVNKITEANQLYRVGKPIMSDNEYDILIEELKSIDPDNDILNSIGFLVKDDDRKRKLSIPMFSMNKIKSINDVDDWSRLKGISKSEYVIITPKFDGLSLCVNELNSEATTRGDGFHGQICDEHYALIQNHLNLEEDPFSFTYGEVMIPKQVFIDKFSADFANPRNLVAGLLNSKTVSDSLKDCQYIKYGAVCKRNFSTKQEVINELNKGQVSKVQYYICQLSDLSEDLLIDLFHKFSTEYEIDGLIIELNDLKLQDRLGRETSSNNPVWARAFKHPSFEQSAETDVIGISWNVSKQGLLKPILHITPVKLDGVTVSNVTGNNARFVKDLGLGVGAKVVVKRSGMVIPIIADVITPVEFVQPTIEGVEVDWNEAGIELITLTETDEQKFKQLVSFFEILETDNFGEGVIKQLWDVGYKTVEHILNLTPRDLEKIDRFGARKSVIVYNSIQKATKDVSLSKLQHATGIFKGLGSLKLVKLEHFKSKPSLEEVMSIEGFAETSASSYIDGYDKFFDFIKDLPITIQEKSEDIKVSNDLEGMSFVFTGVRRQDLVKIIESRGGKEGSSISKTTTHLVCADKTSGSSKMKKAMDLGVKILDVKELEEILIKIK